MNLSVRTILQVILLLPFAFVTAQASDKDSVSAGDYYIEGVREFCAGEYDKAGELLSRCVWLNPYNDAAWYYMSMIQIGDNHTDQALDYLDKAISLSPDNQWYRLTKARLYSGMGESERAIELYNALIEENPEKSNYYYELTDLLMRNSKLDEALETLDRIDELRGVSEVTGNARYEILMAQSRYDEALMQAPTTPHPCITTTRPCLWIRTTLRHTSAWLKSIGSNGISTISSTV